MIHARVTSCAADSEVSQPQSNSCATHPEKYCGLFFALLHLQSSRCMHGRRTLAKVAILLDQLVMVTKKFKA